MQQKMGVYWVQKKNSFEIMTSDNEVHQLSVEFVNGKALSTQSFLRSLDYHPPTSISGIALIKLDGKLIGKTSFY
jgi:hypothetical protein